MRLPELECACASLRRAARMVTQLYSKEMGSELEPGQFSLLLAFERNPGANQTPVARAMGLDKTTMSRNLRVLLRNGWLEEKRSEDRRERGYRLTPGGTAILESAKPGWRRAQAKLREALGAGNWENTLKLTGRIASALTEDGNESNRIEAKGRPC